MNPDTPSSELCSEQLDLLMQDLYALEYRLEQLALQPDDESFDYYYEVKAVRELMQAVISELPIKRQCQEPSTAYKITSSNFHYTTTVEHEEKSITECTGQEITYAVERNDAVLVIGTQECAVLYAASIFLASGMRVCRAPSLSAAGNDTIRDCRLMVDVNERQFSVSSIHLQEDNNLQIKYGPSVPCDMGFPSRTTVLDLVSQ